MRWSAKRRWLPFALPRRSGSASSAVAREALPDARETLMLPGVSSCDGAIARLRNGELLAARTGTRSSDLPGDERETPHRLCALRAELEWRT